jgi:hypothetical protein
MEGRVLIPGRGKIFLFLTSRLALWTAQLSVQRVPVAVSPRLKRQGREADHSPPPNAVFMNCAAKGLLPIRLHGVVFKLSTGITLHLF